MTKPIPLPGQMFAVAEIDGDYDEAPAERTLTPSAHEANLITSIVADNSGMHRPVLDIDVPCVLVPSSTPGHFHLYIDKPMSWKTYHALLCALGEAGILEGGYVGASIERGHTAVRLPWVSKPEPAEVPR